MKPPPEEPSASSNRAAIVLLLVAALLPFAGTLAFGYVMDDTTVIRSNESIRGWTALLRVWTEPYGSADTSGLYRPVLMTLFALVWNAAGHFPVWFHVLAVGMHMGATVLVWRLLSAGIDRGPALLAAAFFAVHPVHAEAVASAANSSEVLVAIWTCLLALCLARLDARSNPGWRGAIAAASLYLAAFLTKESGAVAPVLAALWLWGWRSRGAGQTLSKNEIARWAPVLVAFGVAGLVVFAMRAAVIGTPLTMASIAAPGLEDLGTAGRMVAVLSLVPLVARLLAWPPLTNPHYGPTTLDIPGALAWALVSAVVIVALVALGVLAAKRGDRRFLASLLWVIVAFLPASNFLVPTGQVLAERTLYLPSIGVAMMTGLAAQYAWDMGAPTATYRYLSAGVLALAASGIAFLGIRANQSASVWRDHPTLFSRMIEADSAGYRGYWLAGLDARYRGDGERGLALLQRAYALNPRERGLLVDYALTLSRSGNHTRAAAIAAELLGLPGMRADPRAIDLYLREATLAWGADSARAEAVRLGVRGR